MRFIALVALLLSTFMSAGQSSFEVITDAAEIQRKRDSARAADEKSLAFLFDDLRTKGDSFYRWPRALYRAPRAVLKLEKLINNINEQPLVRIRAGLALQTIGIEHWVPVALEILRGLDAPTQTKLLRGLQGAQFSETHFPPLRALGPYLETLLTSPDAALANSAAELLFLDPRHTKALAAYYPCASDEIKRSIASMSRIFDAAAFNDLAARGDHNAVYEYLRDVNRPLPQNVLNTLRAQNKKKVELRTTLLLAPDAEMEDVPALEAALNGTGDLYERIPCAEALGRLKPEAKIRFLGVLRNFKPESRDYHGLIVALAGLGSAGKGSQDRTLLQAIRDINKLTENDLARYCALAAFSIGGADSQALGNELLAHCKPFERFQTLFAKNAVTPQQAWDILYQQGFALAPRVLSFEEMRYHSQTDANAIVFWGLSSVGCLTHTDAETSSFPNEHDRLIDLLAQNSRGEFRPEASSEQYVEDGDGHYVIQFIHSGKLYRFIGKNFGDWFDVEAVVHAANRALTDAGREARFIGLDTGGQDIAYVCAKPRDFQTVVTPLNLPVLEGKDVAREVGKAAEAAVWKAPLWLADDLLEKVIGKKLVTHEEAGILFWAYIEKNNLIDPKNRTKVLTDPALRALADGKEFFTLFELNKIISKHLSEPMKKDDSK